jgi:pimeloyl-ACP methyl ester carboxylesterase
MEHADFVTMRAPRPTLINTTTRDEFDIDGSWTTFREAKVLYGLLGYGERVDLFEYDDGHAFSRPGRVAAMRWMRRWLLGKDDAPVEEDFPLFADRALQCTTSGQVLEEFRGKSVFDLNAEREETLALRRAKLQAGRAREDLLKEVRGRMAWPHPPKAVNPQTVGLVHREGYDIEKLVFETEPGITVPALFFRPLPRAGPLPPLVLYLHGEGKARDAGRGGPIERRVKAGQGVLAPDLRGMGETTPPNDWAACFGDDWKEAFLGLHLGRPLLGQRVYDVIAILESMGPSEGVHLIGIGSAAPIALHAAALDSRVRQLTLEKSLLSWSAVARTPIHHNQLTNAVPGALGGYDLPDLAEAFAPRSLSLRSPVDAAGKLVSQEVLEEVYAGCKAAYRDQGAEKGLVLGGGQ